MNQPPKKGNGAPQKTAPSSMEPAAVRRFFLQLLVFSTLLSAGGLLWRGLDFALAVLVGSLIVVANFLWTRRVVGGFLLAKTSGLPVAATYLAKLALTGLVLYLALVPLALDPIGIVVGVSSLLFTGLFFAAAGFRVKS